MDRYNETKALIKEYEELLHESGDIVKLEMIYKKIIEIMDQINPKNHYDNLMYLSRYIETKLFLRHYKDLDELFNDYEERVYSEPIQPIFIIYYYYLYGRYKFELDLYHEAEFYFSQAYNYACKYQQSSSMISFLIYEYAQCLVYLKDYKKAEEIIQGYIGEVESQKELYILLINQLTKIYKESRNYGLFRDYVEILGEELKLFNEESMTKERMIMDYASYLIDLDCFKEAKKELEECYYRLSHYGEDHYLKIDVLRDLADLCEMLGEKENERKYVEKVYDLLSNNNKESLEYYDCMLRLAHIYAKQGNQQQALDFYKQTYQGTLQMLGEQHTSTLCALYYLKQYQYILEPYDTYHDEIIDIALKVKQIDIDLFVELSYKILDFFIRYNIDYQSILSIIKEHIESYDEIPPDLLFSLGYYLHYANNNEAKDYALKGYEIVKNNKDITKSYHLAALRVMILCGFHDYQYFKEFFDLCREELLLLYTNQNVIERNDKAKILEEIYTLFKENASIEAYNELLRYKNIMFDMEYYYQIAIKDEETSKIIEMKESLEELFRDKGLIHLDNYSSIFEQAIQSEKLKELLYHDYLLEDVQRCLVDHECLIDFYDASQTKMFVITNNHISLYDYNEEILKDFNHYNHIYICNDGKTYHYIFEDLLETSITYLSSAKYLLYDQGYTESNKVEVIGDIDYDGLYSMHRGEYHTLAFSRYEVNAIKDLFKFSQLHHHHVSKEEFMQIKHPYILHVSAHGDYDDSKDLLDKGSILLVNGEKVTSRDIMKMDFSGTVLVSLASCYSGKGEDVSFEGVYGLRRAFELAGTRTLILVRDQINDMIAAAFMTYFYLYCATFDMLDAFRLTKEKMMHLTLKEFDELFQLNETIIKENKLGFYRKELYYLLNNKEVLKKELNKFMIQGAVR